MNKNIKTIYLVALGKAPESLEDLYVGADGYVHYHYYTEMRSGCSPLIGITRNNLECLPYRNKNE